MKKISRPIIPGVMVGIISAALALAIGAGSALAQNAMDTNIKSYLLTTPDQWGPTQDAAVRAAGGMVTFSHAASGIGAAQSGSASFLQKVLKKGAFNSGAVDMNVQWVEPANEQVTEDDLISESVNATDDRFINLLWNMRAINAPTAWAAGYDGAGVRVAVIDGGMCSLHPDVAPNLDVAASRSFVPGFNWFDDTGGATAFRHACHVAGIIAAVDNTRGTVGVAPRATIISCKALHGGSGSFEAVIQAILYASDPTSAGGGGADIINMSLGATFAMGGGNTGDGQLIAALNKAVNYATSHNVLVVSSAGNGALDLDHSGNIITVPAQSGSGIAVSATAPQDWAGGGSIGPRTPASYTNYGHSVVWVGAPGGDFAYPGNENCSLPVVSPLGTIVRPCWVFDGVFSPGSQSGSYFWASGTSMAAPHVCGVAALVRQRFPGISVGDLKTWLAQTADDVGGTGADPFLGHGFLNAGRAVTDPPYAAFAAAPAPIKGISQGNPLPIEPVTPKPRFELAVAQTSLRGTSFSFSLPAASQARLELFDVAGRRVAVLYDGAAAAGHNAVNFNGHGVDGQTLRSGAYFARLTSGKVQSARKLIMMGP